MLSVLHDESLVIASLQCGADNPNALITGKRICYVDMGYFGAKQYAVSRT